MDHSRYDKRHYPIVDVQQGYGDIYEVALGAPLPGLGPVREIKRDAGRWVVVTPRGLIVSPRDRRSFED